MIRKAKVSEVPEIRRMLSEFAKMGEVLPRTLANLYSQVRDYSVYRKDEGPIIGVAALHVSWDGLGEIRSLVVAPEHQGQGIGSQLVRSCLEEARQLELRQVFVLTASPEFFQRFGFRLIPRENLPPIVWADCVDCVKFPDCDEIPMMLDL
jgi:amino-acid N-acetyltransferase|uniref:N-acetyltransferase n=1 Tax=Desulfobacca acetoxidans TaxID=60893 RepID=A0A7C3WS27_9BACT